MKEQLRVTAAHQYHPLMVVVHWLIASIVLFEALIGVGILHFWPNTAAKTGPLTLHMVMGLALTLLVVIQLAARSRTPRPLPAKSGSALLEWIAAATHALLYLFTLLVAGSGVLLALQSHVLRLVAGRPVSFPMSFEPFVHAAIFVIFSMLVALHIAGALYHQLILRDRLLSRMSIVRRERYTTQVGERSVRSQSGNR